jgi:hypothetical protein
LMAKKITGERNTHQRNPQERSEEKEVKQHHPKKRPGYRQK